MIEPLIARTRTFHRAVGPVAHNHVRVIVVRCGTGIMFSEFGERPVGVGDAILIGASVLYGLEPEGLLTCTTISIDTDFALDQFFWQHAAILHDRFDAQGFAEKVYTEPAQILRIGRDRAGMLMPWLDEMVALSIDGRYRERFHRMQALWFAVTDVLAPFIKVSPARLTRLQRARSRPFAARDRPLSPLRREAMVVRDALHRDLARAWTLPELAGLVRLSPRQLNRVFTDAFGKSPTSYLVMLRVQEMARLLRETNITVAAASLRVGWRSRSRAIEAFTLHTGVTPSRYRDMRPRIAEPA